MSRKPNVIVFFTDQQRWDTSGLHGNPLNLTPNFDRLAGSGTHIDTCITCQPLCGPARSCLQTGLYATQTGSWRNNIPLHPDMKTLAHHYRNAGYQTAYIGKWHLGSEQGAVPKNERGGYEYWLAANLLELFSDSYDCILFDEDNERVKLPGYRVDAMTDAAIQFVDRANQEEDPFFLFLSFLEPHQQNHLDDFPPPDGYRERFTGQWIPPDLQHLGGSSGQHLGGYFGMVKRLDEALGRLQDALKSLQIDRETIILYTSDHGCHFKTRNREFKRSCHEASVRVPTAFCGPATAENIAAASATIQKAARPSRVLSWPSGSSKAQKRSISKGGYISEPLGHKGRSFLQRGDRGIWNRFAKLYLNLYLTNRETW